MIRNIFYIAQKIKMWCVIHQAQDEAQAACKVQLCQQVHVKRVNSSCQIEESTPNNTYGFQVSLQNLHEAKAICEVIYKL
jgi:hypothetical protein